jgi:hypothetical protein
VAARGSGRELTQTTTYLSSAAAPIATEENDRELLDVVNDVAVP